MSKNIDNVVCFSIGIVIGVVITTYIPSLLRKSKSNEADDKFQSLFYSKLTNEQAISGRGFPETNTIDIITKQKLLTVHPEYRRLDIDLYKKGVSILCFNLY